MSENNNSVQIAKLRRQIIKECKIAPRAITPEECMQLTSPTGNLSLHNLGISALPENLRLVGRLSINEHSLRTLPRGMEVGGLTIRFTDIKSLPLDLVVNGSTKLWWLSQLRELPLEAAFNGPITIGNCGLERLPDGFIAKGDLEFYGNRLQELPKGLVVNGMLVISDEHLETLPEDLVVNGRLQLMCPRMTKLPKGLRVEQSLDITRTNIHSLPKNMVVGGKLYTASKSARKEWLERVAKNSQD